MNMNNGNDLHYNGKYRIERYTESIEKSEEITPENKRLILEFFDLCKAQGLDNARLSKTLWITHNLGTWMGKKSFTNATEKDMIELVNLIQEKYDNEWTRIYYKVMLKNSTNICSVKAKRYPMW